MHHMIYVNVMCEFVYGFALDMNHESWIGKTQEQRVKGPSEMLIAI